MPVPDLTERQLSDIRCRVAIGGIELLMRLAGEYGISVRAVDAIVRGRPWRHLARSDERAIGDLFAPRRRKANAR